MLANTNPAPLNSATLSGMNSDLSPPAHPPQWTQTTSGRSSHRPPPSAAGAYTSALSRFGSTPGIDAQGSVAEVAQASSRSEEPASASPPPEQAPTIVVATRQSAVTDQQR